MRRLIEDEQVSILFQTIGTAPNAAIRKYYNQKKVPDIWLGSGASMFVTDPKEYPWSIPFQPSYRLEGQMYAQYILTKKPTAKIAILYQNDDLGRSYLKGFMDGLGPEHEGMIVKTASYEVSEPTVDSQVISLQASGADVLLIAASPKFAAQAIRKAADLGWKPTRYIVVVSSSIAAVLKPAGLDNSRDLISAISAKDVTDLQRRVST